MRGDYDKATALIAAPRPGEFTLRTEDLAALGIPDEKSYVLRYCERTGRADPQAVMADWNFYLAYNLFRLAGIYGPGRSAFDDLRAGKRRQPGELLGGHRVQPGEPVGAGGPRTPVRRVERLVAERLKLR